LSGEALQGKKPHGIDHSVLASISRQIKELRDLNVDVAIVLGGGNKKGQSKDIKKAKKLLGKIKNSYIGEA
jgi:uridylate kinase